MNITDTAQVTDNAQVAGNAQVTGYALVTDNAQVGDNAQVTGYALVADNALVANNARVGDYAQVRGNAWVSGNSRVYRDAWVNGNSRVTGRGDISSIRHVLTVGPVGSEGRHVTIHRHYDGPDSAKWGHLVIAGCWWGTLDELDERIHSDHAHGWYYEADRWRADYEALIAYARHRVAEWEAEPLTDADHDRWAR